MQLLLFNLILAASLIGFISTSPTSKPPLPEKNCGYKSCHPIKKGFINVHIVPHTHDDVGWLKTVDQYYYGSNTKYQTAGVQYILDTVVDSLRKDKNRRFIYVETAFFWKWWIKQHDIVKSRVRKLVYNGQLEFISGGWSMNDEAVTHYQSIIDQMTWGLRKLNETFGECGRPKIGWQIDPFGHSREMASIFAQLGFDGVLLGRIDYQEKRFRWQTRTPEMVWRGSDSLGEASDIFTGVMYNTYSPPPGFCFDILCGDEPVIDDKKSFEYNVDRRVAEFVAYLDNVTQVYTTNNVIITMGDDFNYQDAESWFVNLDKLIYYVNQLQLSGSKYNLIYSTPSCYVNAIHDETKNNWIMKQDDFFPYASDPHAFWTGYFTSRPAIKRFERLGNNFLQVCKQLYALADLGPEDMVDLNALREAMGVMQHHDAITGTEKQHVASDYARQLQRGMDECEIITNAAIRKLLEVNIELKTCPLLNVSQCTTTTTNDGFVVTIYNPLSRPVDKVVRLPVKEDSYSVNDLQGTEYKTQIIPIPDFIKNIPGRSSQAKNELIFIARGIPALGWKSYRVMVYRKTNKNIIVSKKGNKHSVKNTAFIIDPNTGLINSLTIKNVSIDLSQNFFYYNGFVGDNSKFENRSSGAYIFRPDGPLQKITNKKVDYKVYEGELVAEIHQTFNEYISQIIRVNAIDDYVEFDWIIGPLPHSDRNGIEVVTKYQSDLKSNSVFYTDSNGKQMLKRVRNFRPSWKVNLSEPVAGNYYPVTTQISIKDTENGLAVLVDRAQGGTSLKDGEIELMLHRNCLHDDSFGVGEALNETAFGRGLVVRGSHYITVGNNGLAALTKDIVQRRLLDTWTFVVPVDEKVKYNMEFAGLKRPLPKSVQILTLEPWTGFDFLLRLEHVFEKSDQSQPVVVALADLFTSFEIISAQETTLGGNQWLKDNHRLHFNTNGTVEDLLYQDYNIVTDYETETHLLRNSIKRHTVINAFDDDSLNVSLSPGQIRTFIIQIKKY
ncbi:unnamed protein product [Ceutorhynchus assimilis]|uniref:Alpha-mannosidase n=1 Tax=Ceutorhynchus assimilis TaxID=467358 RepID=A0A9N9QDL7_9CUCU|nr:unnamed protein product [Ceutorhynchus assimilis]